jgi:hypothetical protein
MSLLPKIKVTWTRVVATGACLLALSAYSAFAPAPSSAASACQCKFQSFNYSEGTCLNGSWCLCMYGDNGCYNCRWVCCCSE